jgi:hypothetical protein
MVKGYPLDRYHFVSCLDGIQKNFIVEIAMDPDRFFGIRRGICLG